MISQLVWFFKLLKILSYEGRYKLQFIYFMNKFKCDVLSVKHWSGPVHFLIYYIYNFLLFTQKTILSNDTIFDELLTENFDLVLADPSVPCGELVAKKVEWLKILMYH